MLIEGPFAKFPSAFGGLVSVRWDSILAVQDAVDEKGRVNMTACILVLAGHTIPIAVPRPGVVLAIANLEKAGGNDGTVAEA